MREETRGRRREGRGRSGDGIERGYVGEKNMGLNEKGVGERDTRKEIWLKVKLRLRSNIRYEIVYCYYGHLYKAMAEGKARVRLRTATYATMSIVPESI